MSYASKLDPKTYAAYDTLPGPYYLHTIDYRFLTILNSPVPNEFLKIELAFQNPFGTGELNAEKNLLIITLLYRLVNSRGPISFSFSSLTS